MRTLVRHRNASVSNPGVVQLGRFNTVLSVNTEEALVYHIQDMERRLYGITTIDIRHLAYEIAEKLNMNNCFSKSTKMAGVDWLQGFLSRHPNLSIRVPTATNLSRAVAFNSVKVIQFFDVYKEILQDCTYDNASIWNMDESGISNVQKPGKNYCNAWFQNCIKDDQWRARTECRHHLWYERCWAIYTTFLPVCQKRDG